VADRPGHQLGGRLGGGEDDVALVLAVLVVDHDHGLPGGDVLERALDGVEADGPQGGVVVGRVGLVAVLGAVDGAHACCSLLCCPPTAAGR
jgi:hypothetical protein